MRSFVVAIGQRIGHVSDPFFVVAQNSEGLLIAQDPSETASITAYADVLSGLGREDLFYGYEADNRVTPSAVTEYWLGILDQAEAQGIEVFAIDYCMDANAVATSCKQSAAHGFVAFAAPSRDLDVIPTAGPFPVGENDSSIKTLAGVRNFLYLVNPQQYPERTSFLDALAAVNVDLLVVDAEAEDGRLTPDEIDRLRRKPNGARRLVLCYLSIGEAEAYRDYWDPEWESNPPDWLLSENPNWPGNYLVRYWDTEWQAIVFDQLDRIMEAGFDGVYLDLVDAYESFEP